ncbi:hypothetical protein AAFX91_14160 [Bradyrhizobium sp. 31Argb]|uniref:hypothetical protein n=1 Tax=unclassified Bradyrhizobium TaxID=2631580 RepID=UPI00102E27CD|nr:hypothetical protein [Bradyrhizobium sp. Leo170]TAI60827.1 hypothetical protein CWO89_38535 [Bradyrhizobium sp. Leo170]
MSNDRSNDKPTKEVSIRKQHQLDRLAKVRSFRPKPVRVTPASDELRKVLKHPNGSGFLPGGGSAEWPNDRFTKRRIADGSVTVEESSDSGGDDRDKDQRHRRQRREDPSSAA